VVTGGPGERALAATVTAAAGLAAAVAAAARVACGDTGVAHLATALGTPSVVLFGPTPPAEWGPPDDPRHAAEPGPGLLEITVAQVVDALRKPARSGSDARRFEWHPATRRWEAPSGQGPDSEGRRRTVATLEETLTWRGQDLYGSGGEKLGKIEEIYLDAETDQPEWALVNTGLFGTKSTFVPLQQAAQDGGQVRVPFDKATVKDAPSMDADGQLSQQEEATLYRHYGLDYGEARSDTGLPEGGAATGRTGTVDRDVSGSTTDDAMTRSEEELRVGTTEREAGRARLRKYVVEDEVTKTVPVRREEVRVEREPITDANVGAATDGPAISEEEHEVVLHEEEAVVEKRAVPKERVRLDKESYTEERQVSDTVRKEEIDVDDAATRRDRP
jgi:uncharacterized protein (TIGR02271 family)